MSGIFGYSGKREWGPVVLGGLRRLEYRGCDSAGVAWTVADGAKSRLDRARSVGRVGELERLVESASSQGSMPGPRRAAIGHTRWATHGAPSIANAHPHFDASGRIALVHNGVIDNHAALRQALVRRGIAFSSETDTETLVQLIGHQYAQNGDIVASIRLALAQVRGAYGIAVICADHPGDLFAARLGSPLLVGIAPGEHFVASDAQALTGQAAEVLVLNDKELVQAGPNGLMTVNLARGGPMTTREPDPLALSLEEIELGAYPHHFIREIHDQPEALKRCLAGRLDPVAGKIMMGGITAIEGALGGLRRAVLVGCGSAWHAARVGEVLFEDVARLPATARYASDLRHRNPIVEEGTLAVAVSQSGETPDTLAALEILMRKGATGFGIVNVPGSPIATRAGAGAFLHAGAEKGAGSTKSFSTQIAVLALLAIELGRRRHLSHNAAQALVSSLHSTPGVMDRTLSLDPAVRELASRFHGGKNWLLLGHGINYPVALEGALKLKEIAGLHAEAMPAAEIKHGPIALVEEGMPVVVVAPSDSTRDLVLANMAEVRGHGGFIIAIATEGDTDIAGRADIVLEIPPIVEPLSPLVSVIPLQLLAYHLAMARGLPVDKAQRAPVATRAG